MEALQVRQSRFAAIIHGKTTIQLSLISRVVKLIETGNQRGHFKAILHAHHGNLLFNLCQAHRMKFTPARRFCKDFKNAYVNDKVF